MILCSSEQSSVVPAVTWTCFLSHLLACLGQFGQYFGKSKSSSRVSAEFEILLIGNERERERHCVVADGTKEKTNNDDNKRYKITYAHPRWQSIRLRF